MFKTMTLLALAAGGAATYMWWKKNGGTGQLDSHIGDVASRVRSAFGADDSSQKPLSDLKEKATDATDDMVEQMEAAGS